MSAQPPTAAPLDERVISSVDRFYPGFTEILETRDPLFLGRLARALSANPSMESLEVLLWMLQYCPSWSHGNGEAAVQLTSLARAVGTLPTPPIVRVLLRGNPDQRMEAAVVLSGGFELISPKERHDVEKALIAALSDTNLPVREPVAATLRRLGTPAGNAALTRALHNPDVTETFYDQATGSRRPFSARQVNAPTFDPETVGAVQAIAPWFPNTLNSLDEQSITQLRITLQRSSDPKTTPVLVWLMVKERGNQWYLPQILATPQRVSRLPLGELASLLVTADPDHQASIAELLKRALALKEVPDASVNEVIKVLMSHRQDSRLHVRANVLTILASAVKRKGVPFAGASEVARQLGDLVRERDLTSGDLTEAVSALGLIGDRTTLPPLERITRSIDVQQQVRESAARAYIAVATPPDPATERRRLLWEQPDTDLERRVRTEGRRALPLAWRMLQTGSARERRAATALLGWYRDIGSIRPILAALDRSPGAVTKEQLLFDLNMILLTDGSPADAERRNALAAAHLRWLYGQLANQSIDGYIREAVLARDMVAVFPDRVVAPFSVLLSAETAAMLGQPRGQVSATASISESRAAFLGAVAKDQCGVAFHAITVAEGVARVATTLYLPRRGPTNQVWISLYREQDGQWLPLSVPPHPVLNRMLNEPNLLPAINRDYGADHPLKVLRLDLTMERIRVDLKAREYLANENLDAWGPSKMLDASYAPLFDRYKHSDVASVRYTAEFESGRLTGLPNVQLWLDTLTEEPGSPFQTMARQVIGTYAAMQVKSEGRQLAGTERDELVTAAVNPEPVDARLLPQPLPQRENIQRVQASARFALVDARFGAAPLGSGGYTMLFERRGERWVFLFVVRGWIS